MATRKGILENKDKWIEALKEVINVYLDSIETGEYKKRGDNCALCSVVINFDTESVFDCDECIHNSTFSMNEDCMAQPSFNKAVLWHNAASPTNAAIRVRIRFLQRIIIRLQKAKP